MIIHKNPKELFEYVRSIDVNIIPSLKEILDSNTAAKVDIDELLNILYANSRAILLIDVRSEKEFEESSIPSSVNFPVLNNSERHNTGLIYKRYSRSAALHLALEYAVPKRESLNRFLSENNASLKDIFIYCWRGGGRSGYLAKMIADLGYNPVILRGGHRSFRKYVNDFFGQQIFPYELIELSGLTGSGKTELLKAVSNIIPVIDLEDAAKHYSSLLGQIPYEINNIPAVKNQTVFENNLFCQIFFNKLNIKINSDQLKSLNPYSTTVPLTFLIESESKKVGDFEIPKSLYEKMQNALNIRIICSVENRVKRIVNDYFGIDLRGTEPMVRKLVEKENFFRQQLSNKIFDDLIDLLNKGKIYDFTEIMIREYYDKKYKDKGKKSVAEISMDDPGQARDELIRVLRIYADEQK